jgi:hypothetical protein
MSVFFLFLKKLCLINFRLNLIIYFENPTNIENFEHMEYINDKILPITKGYL